MSWASSIEQLVNASREGDVAAVTTLATSAVEVNRLNTEGFSPLYAAAMRGQLEVVRLLLRVGAMVDMKGADDETALYIATRNHHADVVRTLLSVPGVKVNESNGTAKETALHCAARMGYADLVDVLLGANANVNARTTRMETPLFLAARFGRVDAAYRLLVAEANRNMTNDESKDAVYVASEHEHKAVVKLLQADKKYLRDVKASLDVELRNAPPSTAEAARRRSLQQASEADDLKAEAAAVRADVSTFVPIDIPKGPDNGVHRTHDPLTGKALPPCRTLMEAGYYHPAPPPPELTRPIDAPRPMGTVIIGADGRPVKVPSLTPGDE